MNSVQDNVIELQEKNLTVSPEEKEMALFRSMYYQMNAKPDSMTRVFSQKVIISREDIVELNERVNKKIRMHYHDDGYIATVTVSLDNREVINFQCWEEFLNYEWCESNCINSIILKWNFNIRMPQYKNPQNHVLMVKLSNGLRPEELLNLIFSGKVEDFEEIETNTFPMAARVDFIEPILGDELLNIVSEWIRGLKENKEKKNVFVLLMRKYRKRVAQYFNYGALAMLTLLFISIINFIIINYNLNNFFEISTDQVLTVFNTIVLGIFVLFFVLKFLDEVAQKIFDILSAYGQGFSFAITKGDKKRQDDIKLRDEKSAKTVIVKFVFSLIFNVTCGIIAGVLVH